MEPVTRTLNAALSAALLAFTLPAAAQALPPAPKAQFVPPRPGTYELPVIDRAPNGRVLDSDGHAFRLAHFTRGRVTLLSFVYTYCVDPVGCPLAYDTMVQLRERLLARPDLARATRFVSLSFDPTYDTPEAMRAYGGPFADAKSPLRWYFLTTRSLDDLAVITEGFGQDFAIQPDQQGRPTRFYNHMLKVFLIDAKGRVREIYSPAFLMPAMMLNDIETLVLEEHGEG